MTGTRVFAIVALLSVPSIGLAQHGGGQPAPPTIPAEVKQLDFLVGQFELVVKVPAQGLAQKIHGVPKLVGTWKGWHAFDGYGIEDELGITDAAGNPIALSHNMRIYDRAARQWSITGLDVYRASFNTACAEWKDGSLNQASHGTDSEGKAYLTRTRFFDITPTGFHFQQDRSFDGGKTWTEKTLFIEAKRTAATAAR